jgi:hypothetical protein
LRHNLGCQKCSKKLVRKIHYPFPYRLCQKCIKDVTISDFRLKEQGINVDKFLSNLKYFTVILWSTYAGNYRLNFYLRKEVDQILEYPIEKYKEIIMNKIKSELKSQYGDDLDNSEVLLKYDLTPKIISDNELYEEFLINVEKYVFEYKARKFVRNIFPKMTKIDLLRSQLIKNEVKLCIINKNFDNLTNIKEKQEEIHAELVNIKIIEKYYKLKKYIDKHCYRHYWRQPKPNYVNEGNLFTHATNCEDFAEKCDMMKKLVTYKYNFSEFTRDELQEIATNIKNDNLDEKYKSILNKIKYQDYFFSKKSGIFYILRHLEYFSNIKIEYNVTVTFNDSYYIDKYHIYCEKIKNIFDKIESKIYKILIHKVKNQYLNLIVSDLIKELYDELIKSNKDKSLIEYMSLTQDFLHLSRQIIRSLRENGVYNNEKLIFPNNCTDCCFTDKKLMCKTCLQYHMYNGCEYDENSLKNHLLRVHGLDISSK